MAENDFDKEIKKIGKRAEQERRQQLAEEKAKKKEAQRIAKAESKDINALKKKEIISYTAVIIAKLEYQGDNAPFREQLAEELGSTIMKWVNQKSYYAIAQKEPVPELVSVDVDIQ